MSIQEIIARVNDRLTPTERRIAQVVTDEPNLLVFGTVSDLADRVGTSRPSIVRFATKLGFEGYSDLQGFIRQGLSSQLNSPSHRIRQQDNALQPIHARVLESIEQVYSALDAKRLARIARPIVKAEHVWIITGETSKAGGAVLQSGLTMLRPGVRLVGEHSTGSELSSADAGDIAIVIDFARYRRNAVTVARTLSDMGVQIIAITDGPLSPLASLAKHWCELRIPAVGPFDSSVPAVMAAELIVAQVAHELGDRARAHIDQLEAMWQATGTFLEYTPRTRSLDLQ